MAEEKKNVTNEEKVEETKEETKATEDIPEQDNGGVENPPAETDNKDEKKGFHPIQAIKNKTAEFSEKHPKVVSGVKTAGKVAGGVVIGAVGTVAVLASIAAKKGAEEDQDDIDDEEDENIIDGEAEELDE